jgi:dipeptidase
MSRITTIELDDPDNWLYAPDVIDFAIEKGYYDPSSDTPFSFREAYHPLDPIGMRVCAARVWSVYRRSAPSQTFGDDFHRGVEGSKDFPLFIKPDTPLGVRDVMGLMRDHFEGTPYDMTTGIDAGPFACPYRWRGLTWEVDDVEYVWERPISSQQAAFVMVTQSRDWLPDPVGGVYWHTPDDCFTTPFTPFYAGANRVPRAFAQGDIDRFSWDSAWWVYNIVSNLTYNTYSRIMPEVAAAQNEVEEAIFAMLPAVEETAVKLYEQDPEIAKRFLTTFSVSTAEGTLERWKELGTHILTTFNDGFVRSAEEGTEGVGYPEAWLRRVIEENPEQFRVPDWGSDSDE